MRGKSTAALMSTIVSWLNPTDNSTAPTKFLPPLFPVLPFGPAVDGTFKGLQTLPLTALRSGRFNKVPTVFGSNRDEGTIFLPILQLVVRNFALHLTEADVAQLLKHFFSEAVVEAIFASYPPSSFPSPAAQAVEVIGDYFFSCSMRRAANALANSSVPSFRYFFNHTLHWPTYPLLGDFHMAELPFVFDHPSLVTPFKPDDAALSAAFGQFWASMAATATPNGSKAPLRWPLADGGADGVESVMVMTTPLRVESDLKRTACEMWDRMLFDQSL
jgi:para-nitrobenzyl esterase